MQVCLSEPQEYETPVVAHQERVEHIMYDAVIQNLHSQESRESGQDYDE